MAKKIEIKHGCGNQRNSCSWSAGYIDWNDKYVAILSLSSAYGCWETIYEISEKTFEKLGTFENDDYISENLIRKGKLIYRYENERNYPEPTEMIEDPCYAEYEKILRKK